MVDSNQFVTDLTTIGGGTAHMIGYAQNAGAGYIEAPSNTQQSDGVVPLDRLPAQWWNWFLNQATRRFSEYETYVENIVAELDGVLDILGITPDAGDPSTVNQLKTMFASHYLQDYLPEVIAATSSFSADATHENHILVADDDGNSGFSVKKVPYAPGFILNTQLRSAAKTITLPANCPFDGETIKITFANGHEAANSTNYMTLNVNSTGPVPIVSNQNGTLANLPIHELTVGTYTVLMSNVTLEMYYTSNGFNSNPAWVVIGNPLVLSSANYSIYADGLNTYKLLNDENELANYEILTTGAAYNATMQYDGFISLSRTETGGWLGTIKRGVSVFTINSEFTYKGFASEYSVKKGDIVSIAAGTGLTVLGSFYKKRNYSYR